jgi:hypothetical protein
MLFQFTMRWGGGALFALRFNFALEYVIMSGQNYQDRLEFRGLNRTLVYADDINL